MILVICAWISISRKGCPPTHTYFCFDMYTLSMHRVECTYISVSSYSLFCTTPLFSQERKDHRERSLKVSLFIHMIFCNKLLKVLFFLPPGKLPGPLNLSKTHKHTKQPATLAAVFFLKRIGSKLCLPVTTLRL